MIYKIILILSLISVSSVSANVDSAVVRIMTDFDNAKIQLNEVDISEDSYGNRFNKNSWFILNLPIMSVKIRISDENLNIFDTTIILIKEEIHTINIKSINLIKEDSASYDKLIESTEVVKLVIQSDPDSCTIIFRQEDEVEKIAPFELFFKPGDYFFLASKKGYEPLSSKFKIEEKTPILANFKLNTIRPEQLIAESLGLSYMNLMPMIDIKSAEKIKVKYRSLAESFAIFPMAQGVLARIVVDKSQHGIADALILSGVGLSVGSYFLGKFLYKKKKNYIIEENFRREHDNSQAESNNIEVDQMVNKENKSRIKTWRKNNLNRGKVLFENLEEN